MRQPAAVDWATDFDVLDPRYVADPVPIWDVLRRMPGLARTDRRGPGWLAVRHGDVVAACADPARFSSRLVTVVPFPGDPAQLGVLPHGLPPITADPPLHSWTRRLVLPWLAQRQVARHEDSIRRHCRRLLDPLRGRRRVDAAAEYAMRVPVHAVAVLLGVDPMAADAFVGWVDDVLAHADDGERRRRAMAALLTYLWEEITRRADHPADDMLSDLLHVRHQGKALPTTMVLGIGALMVLAGVDTTAAAIGASLAHLAAAPEDARRLRRTPGLLPTAIEELLRVNAPVTMARVVTDSSPAGAGPLARCPMHAGDRLLLSFAAANRDPVVFPDAGRTILDRGDRRHLAFGSGIHRCAGTALARLQLRVALGVWLDDVAEFHGASDAPVTWNGGQVRGPRTLPVDVTWQ